MKRLATRFIILNEHTHKAMMTRTSKWDGFKEVPREFETAKAANEFASQTLSSWVVLEQCQYDDTPAYSYFWRTIKLH